LLRLSEHQLQSELDLPRRIRGANGSESRAGGLGVRNAEIRVIEDVKELRPELQLGLFADAEVLIG
jgi:hypothetical protein